MTNTEFLHHRWTQLENDQYTCCKSLPWSLFGTTKRCDGCGLALTKDEFQAQLTQLNKERNSDKG